MKDPLQAAGKLIERRITEYLDDEIEKLGAEKSLEIRRDMHPRSHTVVVFKFLLGDVEHVRYADFDAGPDKPFPHFTDQDPCPIHS